MPSPQPTGSAPGPAPDDEHVGEATGRWRVIRVLAWLGLSLAAAYEKEFEDVRLDARPRDVVCLRDGAGQGHVGGEGIVGLTRAFQFAGARSVLASLWSVSDESTAELMRRFDRALARGATKDEALRAAQLALMAGPVTVTDADGAQRTVDATHPFYRAAFSMVGDWR